VPSLDERGSRATLAFAARLAVLFAVTLLPISWLADAYTAALGVGTNAVLSALDGPSRVAVRFEPLARIEARGSWKANLRVEDRSTGRERAMRLDVRSLSYRPVAMFLVLTAASFRRGWKRNLIIWGVGSILMFAATTGLSALPLLARFGAAGGFGTTMGIVAQTTDQALATPVMVVAIAVGVWACVSRMAAVAH